MPRPLLLGAGPPPPQTLIVDCGRTDGAATWSHWPGAPALPEAWRADTSTGQVLRALADDPGATAPFAWVANDHIDTDGLLAVSCACIGPTVLARRDLMEAAAEAGDFSAAADEAATTLCWRIHRLIAEEQAAGGDWKQRCLERCCDQLMQLCDDDGDADLVAAWQNCAAARRRIVDRDGIRIDALGDVVSLVWQRDAAHAWDQFNRIPVHEPWPLWAFSGHWPETRFQLHAEILPDSTPPQTTYVAYAPFHSWAGTVNRPRVPWPNTERAIARLTAMETGSCRWVGGEAARAVAFTAVLASVDAQGRAAASQLGEPIVAAALREALRSRPACPAPSNPRP